jgi:citrate lyase subunit beta/citryl-CoA lyase
MEKDSARENILKLLPSSLPQSNTERVVRVNGIATSWFEQDMGAVAKSGVSGLVVPKVESAACVRRVLNVADNLLTGDSSSSRIFNNIWVCIETPRGVLNAMEICESSDRISTLIMGTSDLTKELRSMHTRDRMPLLHSLSHCLLAARATGKDAIDGVHLDLADEDGFKATCRLGREMGFDGRSLIHPKTVATANEIYSPSQEHVKYSRDVINAWELAVKNGSGVTVLNGKLIENLHVEEARRVLHFAELIKRV